MKSTARYRVKTVACVAFAITSLVLTTAIAVGATSGAVQIPGLRELGLGAEARADVAARDQQAPDVAFILNRSAIESAPMNASAWLRVAYLRSQSSEALDDLAIDGIRRSYSVAPFGPDVTTWRLQFLYGHWSQIPLDLRQEAMAEHRVYGRLVAIDDASLADPAGKLTAVMMNARVRARRTALSKNEKNSL